MNALKKIAVMIALACIAYALWSIRGRKVAHWRLDRIGIVAKSCEPRLVYSSGYLRENTHVFETKRGCLVGDAAISEEDLKEMEAEWEDGGHRLVLKALEDAFGEVDAEAFVYVSGFDDASLTSYGLALSKRDDTVYVMVRSF
jgi:hypothetical protein